MRRQASIPQVGILASSHPHRKDEGMNQEKREKPRPRLVQKLRCLTRGGGMRGEGVKVGEIHGVEITP